MCFEIASLVAFGHYNRLTSEPLSFIGPSPYIPPTGSFVMAGGRV
jgi:hypothetical protein